MYVQIKKAAAAVSAAMLMLTQAVPAVHADEESSKLRLMCLGDSITDGFWLTGGYRNTLCSLISEAGFAEEVDFVGPNWGGSGYDPQHAGYSGYSVADIPQADSISGQRTGLSGFADWLMENYPADLVFLQIGTNDILSLYDLDNYGSRLEVLVDQILRTLPDDGMLYLATLPVMDATNTLYINEYYFTVESMDAAVDACNAQIRSLVTKKQADGCRIRLAEVNKVLTKSDLYDGVHPSEEGYRKLGTFWYQTLVSFRADEPAVQTTAPAETTATSETTTTAADIAPLHGDVDLDGQVAVSDAVLLVQALTAQTLLTPDQGGQADMDENRKINGVDLTLLKRAL